MTSSSSSSLDAALQLVLVSACVDESKAVLPLLLRTAMAVQGAGLDTAPLVLIHDVMGVLLRGRSVRLCGSRERVSLEGLVQDDTRTALAKARLDVEDRVLAALLRDPSVLAAHVLVAGARSEAQEAVLAHAVIEVLPALLSSTWPTVSVGRTRALLESVKATALGPTLGANDLDSLDDDDVFAVAQQLVQVQTPSSTLVSAEALWELLHLEQVPSEATRMALRTVHRLSAAMPSPSPEVLRQLRDRRAQVPTEDVDVDTFPAGGFDAMSTRGTFENLVRSEVGYVGVGAEDDARAPDLFDVRFVEGELLFYTRDESPLLQRQRVLSVQLHDVQQLRHKRAELPSQTLVLCEACVLRAFADLQGAVSAHAIQLQLWLSGSDDVVDEEVGLLRTSLAADIAQRRASVTSGAATSTVAASSSTVTFSQRPPPDTHSGKRRGLWIRVGTERWQVTPAVGEAFDVDVSSAAGLRQIADLLLLLC